MPKYQAVSGSAAEDLFIDLFSETFGAEKAGYLYSQYPFFDICQNSMIYLGWDVYHWAVCQMQIQPGVATPTKKPNGSWRSILDE